MMPHTGVVGLFYRVIVDAYGEIIRIPLIEKVALSDDASISLFQVGRSPRSIKVMSGHKPLLHVHARTHLGGRIRMRTRPDLLPYSARGISSPARPPL